MSDVYIPSIKISEKSAWIMDEVMAEDCRLDLSKQFMPLSFKQQSEETGNFSKEEYHLLSQLMASNYCDFIAIVERYIVDLVMKQFPMRQEDEKNRMRALSRFLDEEVKHQLLFERFNKILGDSLNQRLVFPNNSDEFNRKVMEKTPLAIWLLTLHSEIMTHYHYTFMFKSGVDLEPKFVEILKFHWTEEATHVKVDLLEIDALVRESSEAQLHQSMEHYVELLKLLDSEFASANVAVIQNFKAISGIKFTPKQDMNLLQNLARSSRELTITSVLRHPTFTKAIKSLNIGYESKLPELSKMFEDPTRIVKAA